MEIVICPDCQGVGKITKNVETSFYDSEYKTHLCNKCNGTGRLVKDIVYKPFSDDIKLIDGRLS